MRLCCLSLCLLLCSVGAQATWKAGEISLLLPLPQKENQQTEAEMLLSPRSGQGLLPESIYRRLPPVVTDIDERTLYEKSLRVVAVRLDPCFGEWGDCRRQIRLVWQPLIKERGVWTTLDGTLHSFYDLTESEWKSLLKRWPRQKTKEVETLGVSVKLLEEGYTGSFWSKISSQILSYCRPDNLVRVTVMTVNPLGNFWAFKGVDIVEEKASKKIIKETPIAGLSEGVQTFMTSLSFSDALRFSGVMSPAPQGRNDFLKLLRNSSVATGEMGAVELKAAVAAAFELENPRIKTTANSDCVSCHASHSVSNWALHHFPFWSWQNDFANEKYETRREDRPRGANVLSAFGYFDTTPVISQRVVNETAEALKLMETFR